MITLDVNIKMRGVMIRMRGVMRVMRVERRVISRETALTGAAPAVKTVM